VSPDARPDLQADAQPDMPSGFRVVTDAFTGTLGELAYALRSGAVEPGEINAFELVQRYLEHYRAVSAGNLELATETLPGLARIIELKLRLLLPQPPKTPEADEEEVIETVLALEAFDEAISFLREQRETRRHLLAARAPRPSYPRRARPLTGQLGRLAEFATRRREANYFELVSERLTLSGALARLREALKKLGRGTLQRLMDARDWPTVTVAFGAMLEMVKEGEVAVQQDEPYGRIELSTVRKPS
jgi:segregation and condensation protein A